jgi:coatomer protein complex subunit alpha (xenin)
MHEFSSSKDVPLVSLRRTTGTTTSGIGGGPRTLVFNTLNKNENNVLVLSDTEGGSYELITFAIDSSSSGDAQDIRRGMGVAAVFIARDRFAVLEKSKQLCIKNFQNEVIKKSTPSVAGVDGLFYGGTSGRVLLKSEDRIVLHDFQARKNVSEIQIARVKYVVWNNDYSLVALISKHQIVLANKQLDQLCTINETVRLKGGCWDASKAIFVYTTSNHVKYVLCNGDRGIIRGLDSPVYVTKLQGNSLYCLDREGKMRTMEVDLVEALFKIALENKEYGEVMKMVKHSRLCGQSIITYLQEKGYPEVALHFVHDNKTRFRLALACGNIQVALNVAYELDEEAWQQLGTEALRQGNYEIVEMAYQKTKSFDQLSFLYLITGNTEKLRKMLKISEMRGDVMGVVHNSMYLGDIEERIKCFESTGQLSLAFMTAVAYNLIDSAKRIEDLLHAASLPIPHVPGTASLLMPPTPIVRGDNWSYLSISQSYLSHQSDNAKEKLGKHRLASNEEEEHFEDATAGGNWGDDDLFNDEDEQLSNQKTSKSAPSKSGWEEDDLDLSDDEVSPIAVSGGIESLSAFVPPSNGNSPQLSWCAESSHCADHFAAGAVESAVQLLNRQIGAINMKPLKSACYPIFAGAQAFLPGICQSPAVRNFLVRESNKTNTGSFPTMVYSVKNLLESLKQAYRLFTAAQFDDCRTLLETILNLAPLVPTSSKSEADDLRELLGICREYLVALQLKSGMDESKDISRSLEFAAYFTHCNLQPSHLILALKAAMALAFKNKVRNIIRYFVRNLTVDVQNFINAASFARRLLDFPEMSSEKNADLRSKAQKVLQKSEQQGRNEYSINYDERNPFR